MIKYAAIKCNGIIYKGRRHMEIIESAKPNNIRGGGEGFLTSAGLFVNREEAARIALANGQIKRQKKKLISEDLW